MKRIALALTLVIVGCDKKQPTVSQQPLGSVSAKSASASAAPSAAAPATLTLKGKYESKQGEVRTPSDAPAFIHVDNKEGLGAGDIEVTLPNAPTARGEVTGTASGALGKQVFSGFLDEGRLTGTLHPAEGATPAMWGFVDATVEGSGASSVVKGTVRASGRDGRVVREATFTLASS